MDVSQFSDKVKGRINVVRILAGLGEMFLLQNAQTDSEAHTTSYLTGVRGSFRAGKVVKESI